MSNKELGSSEREEQTICKEEVKKKKIDILQIGLLLVGVLCIVIASYSLSGIFTDYKKGEDVYTKIEDEFVVVQPQKDEDETKELPWYELADVNVAGLKSQYEDVVGWIFFEKEDISYPIMQGKDNDEYLHNAYDGEWVKAGSIFMDYRANPDYSDTHTVIYGHNMGNLSMFGRLRFYRNYEGYYDDHMYFQIFTEDEILRYQIFSYQVVSSTDDVYQREDITAKELSDKLMKTAIDGKYLDIEEEDKIVTLSTCTNADDKERLIVNAVLIERHDINKK